MKRESITDRDEKWIYVKFFIDLDGLLRKYIEPKSKFVAKQIKTIVKVICRLHGYWWQTKVTDLRWEPDDESTPVNLCDQIIELKSKIEILERENKMLSDASDLD
jgi:hypothetical protein